ncbi:hypothetical protein [Polaribacter sp. KT25b]|nr:hypothetical protein [Polaribacter sp. KT25b]
MSLILRIHQKEAVKGLFFDEFLIVSIKTIYRQIVKSNFFEN